MKKSRWDIIGSDIYKDNLEEYDRYLYYWYDGEYDFDYYDYCDNCGKSYCQNYEHCQTYDYTELPNNKVTYISKSFGNWKISHMSHPLHGRYIDMMSIYPKTVLRQMKIDYLLGVNKWEFVKNPTLGDIFKINK